MTIRTMRMMRRLLAVLVASFLALAARPADAALTVGALGNTNKLYEVSDSGAVSQRTLSGVSFVQQLAPVLVNGSLFVTDSTKVVTTPPAS